MKRMLCVALSLVLALATVPAYALDPATDDATVGESEVEPLDKNPADNADNADNANETIGTEECVPAETGNPNADDTATEKEAASEDAEAPRGSKRSESITSEEPPSAILSEDAAPAAKSGASAPADLPFVVVDKDGNPAVFGSDYRVDDTSLVVTGRSDSTVQYQRYTISMAEGVDQTDWNIVVEGDAPYVNLKSVSIKTNNTRGALVQTGAQETCEVWFEGENHLECSKGAGVYVDSNGSINLSGANEDGTDTLVAIGGRGCPGIGVVDTMIRPDDGTNDQESSADLACGGISIDNLQVEAQGGSGAAGIGCGMTVGSSLAKSISLTNSLVRATGGEGGAGIGSGFAETLVAVRSSDATADGESDAEASCASHIEIYSSDVTATGGEGGAGIGSGAAERLSRATGIQIHGGSDVEATGKNGGAGIGSGCTNNGNSETSQISVEDARVLATSTTGEGSSLGGAGIGAGAASGRSTLQQADLVRASVVTEGGYGASGIGSGRAKTGNSETDGIVIEGGDVDAIGGYGAAGIGSGRTSKGDSIATNLSFKDGSVTATTSTSNGFACSSGIGSGSGLNSVADDIFISGGAVRVTSPTDGIPFYAAGIGSGALLTEGDTSAARNIQITGGEVDVDWNGAYAPAIGSGGTAASNGKSEARDITISGGQVNARGECGGIGSGVGAIQSLADGISISGGTVTAVATNGHYKHSAIGSGLIMTQDGASITRNVCISGGDVTAWTEGGGTAFGPKQHDESDEMYSTEFSGSAITPQAGFQTSMWAGDSAATAKLLLDGEKGPFDLTALDAPYATIMFSEAVYDVWVSGVQVTPDNAGDVLGDGTVSFSPSVEEGTLPDTGKKQVGTLTLNGAKLKGTEGENHGAGIYAQGALVIVLAEGSENTVDGAFGGEGSDSDAVSVSQALAIRGSGTLDARAAHVEGDGSSVGISCEASYNMEEGAAHGGYLLITDSAHVFATGGSAELAAERCASMGIAAYSELVVEKDAVLAAQAGAAAAGTSSMGAFGTRVALHDNARIGAVGGKGDTSVGVGCTEFQVTGGALVAQSDPTAATQHAAVMGAMDLSSYADYSWRTAPDGAYTHLNFAQPEQTDYLEIAPGNLVGGASTGAAGKTATKVLAATGDGAIPVVATLGVLAILAASMLAIACRRQRCTVSETKRRLYHE